MFVFNKKRHILDSENKSFQICQDRLGEGKKSVLAWCMLSKTQNTLLGLERKMPSLFLDLQTDGLAQVKAPKVSKLCLQLTTVLKIPGLFFGLHFCFDCSKKTLTYFTDEHIEHCAQRVNIPMSVVPDVTR